MNVQAGVVEEARNQLEIHDTKALRDSYTERRDCYFSSPKYALLAKPPFANLLNFGGDPIAKQARESLRFALELGHKNSVVIGAIPFDSAEKPFLRLSCNARFGARGQGGELSSQPKLSEGLSLKPEPSPEVYVQNVIKALACIESTPLRKVVLSRTLQVQSSLPFSVKALVEKLEQDNPFSYVFAVDLLRESNGHFDSTFVGASPELLISVRNGKIVANPLAGSEPRSDCPEENKRRSDCLMASQKDRHEHKLVVDDVVRALAPMCQTMSVPVDPSVIQTPTMLHLSTEITGELKSKDTSSLDVALALHPTPAVCGYPFAEARSAIADIEQFNRDAFTGVVGWCDAKGDGDWVVSIRCANICGSAATLYAGAGIVKGSSPEKECAETQAKFNTMLNALQGVVK